MTPYELFLGNQVPMAGAINQRSTVVRLLPEPGDPPRSWMGRFDMPYIRHGAAGPEIAPGPIQVLICFPDDYLYSVDPRLCMRVVAVLNSDILHPNLRPPGACLGSAFSPGTSLTNLVEQLHAIFSYENAAYEEHLAMSPPATRLLRAHPELLTRLERRPLFPRMRKLRIQVRAL
jgi:hypothetical protein